jgi:transposase
MPKVIDILRLKHEAGLSHEKIGCVVGLSKGAVGKYVNLAKAVGITWPLPPSVDEAQLESLLLRGQDKPASKYAQPDFSLIHQELKRKGVTLQLLWAEYAEAHGASAYRYSQFCFHYQRWHKRQKRSMRQLHRAGEKLFIDYCGPTVPIVDAATGELRQAQVFVAVLGASSYTYAEATWTQELPQWIASHQRAFAFFGGVVELLVPDNLLSGVTKACRYDPQPNATYQELARHYGCAILPARPYKPKDKAKAEVGVQVVERWILARLRHHTFFSLAELNAAIRDLLVELNARPFQKLPGSRKSAFEALDKPTLKPLPGGNRPSPASITTSRSRSATTASRTAGSAMSWMCAPAPASWRSSTRANASPVIRAATPSSSPRSRSTCPAPTVSTASGHRGAS